MIGALARVPGYKLMYRLGWPRVRPLNVTISTTFRCNSRCLTCNVYERPVDELTVEEWNKVFESLGRSVRWFTFSGGEPFLRRDLAEIVEAAYLKCSPEVINIPTNGTFPDRVVASVERLVERLENAQLVINVSLDAVGERNDVIRGMKNDFALATETFRRLRSIEAPNLTVGIHSVISNHNVREFPLIAKELMRLEPDQYIVEPAEERVELQTIGSGITPSLGDFNTAISAVEHGLRAAPSRGLPRLTRAIRLAYYRLARETLGRGQQVVPCYAAIASAHIAANGDVWGCCTKAISFGNLREAGYDFNVVWGSDAAKRERQSIKNRECACPLANAAYTSMLCNLRSLARIALNMMRRRRSLPTGKKKFETIRL